MFLSISHWPVGFKGPMEKRRGQLGYVGENPSRERGYYRNELELLCLSRVLVSATRPWLHSISSGKVSFFSPIKFEAKDMSQIKKEAVKI
jgi:hypothetical protein